MVGVVFLNLLVRRGKIHRMDSRELSDSVTVDTFQDMGEMPISESLDKLSMQVTLVLFTYLLSFLAIWGLTAGIGLVAPGLGQTVNSLLWGFNFMLASCVVYLAGLMLFILKVKGKKE